MQLSTEYVGINELTPHPENPRQGNVDAIAESLEVNGQYRPIVANHDTVILAGNHTWMAAQKLGWKTIWVSFINVSWEKGRQILLADNRHNDLAGYDEEALLKILQEVELEGTGFDDEYLQKLLDKFSDDEDDEDSGDSVVEEAPAITEYGDIWELGNHRIICGDCRDWDYVSALVGSDLVNVIFTSPPYADKRDYDEDSGFVPIKPSEYVDWWEAVQANMRNVLAKDGSFFVNIKPGNDGLNTDLYVFDLVISMARRWGWHFATEFCWERIGVPGNVNLRFKNQFEPIYQFALGEWKTRPESVRHYSENVPSGGKNVPTNTPEDRKTKGVGNDRKYHKDNEGSVDSGYAYPGNRLPPFVNEAWGHTAAFPVGLCEFFVKAFSDNGDIVLDPFVGSGSSIIAAEKCGRIGLGIELSAEYCDIICKRFQQFTGVKPMKNGEAYDFGV